MFFLLCLSAFVVSGDVFFTVQAGGFNLRLYQLLTLPAGVSALRHWARDRERIIGRRSLLLFTFIVVLFTPNTYLLSRSAAYSAWLVSDVLLVLAIYGSVRTWGDLDTLLRWYVYSFAFSAVFGLLQLLLPLAGITPPLVQQWWVPGLLPRINGFTYEPSYYATYMLTGYVVTSYLLYRRSSVIPHLRAINTLIGSAVVLSSSRMGWVFMAIWFFLTLAWRANEKGWKSVRRPVSVLIVAACLAVSLVAYLGLNTDDLSVVWKGLGVFEGDATYSVEGRSSAAEETLKVFARHPIIGVGLGGIAPEIGIADNVTIRDNEDAKANEGMCTSCEVLAAGGIFGFVAYVSFFGRMLVASFKTVDGELTDVTKALAWGLVFLLSILQFNQNILRGYVWFHVGILGAALSLQKLQPEKQSPPSR